jgi:ubiquinone/menaquinone biosynthesis C-methylase UbiE
MDMIRLANFMPEDLVLDIGCGIGGPSRTIASECNCKVTGVDLHLDYCKAARSISKSLGLGEQTHFIQANALNLPFEDRSYDAVWAQHITMNISNKNALWREFYRVLKPDGKLFMYEVTCNSDDKEKIKYPTPWASKSEDSFLENIHNYKESLNKSGFFIEQLQDVSSIAKSSIKSVTERIEQGGHQRPGLEIVLGDRFSVMMENLLDSLNGNQLNVVRMIAAKSSSQP